MRKNIIILIAIMCLGLSGCKGKTAEAAPINNNDNIAESEANTEYDSIEDFLTRSNVSVFMMDSNSSIIATYSNAAAFSAVDKKVSVAESYIAITYECETNGETVRRHIVGGANRTLFSVDLPPRLCRTGT